MKILILSLLISLILGPIVIPILVRLKAGQSIREDGPQSHLKKSGTPTIGGIIFITATIITLLITGYFTKNLIPILSMLGFGLIGFIDDFIKVVLKRNLGLTAKQKILGQIIVSLGIGLMVNAEIGSSLIIPFFKSEIDLGILFIPFIMIVMIATSNSANLTDGLDGLATSVTIIILGAFALISKKYSDLNTMIFAIALIGACIGFLRVNINPAKVFMGDAGSMALGGAVVGIAMVLRLEILIPIIALIYFIESLSVIIQVMYYKKTKKRVFLMAPIHHHYEHKGMTENQIVFAFSFISLILGIISYFVV
ncbi:MAG: phospho-N-acetylmuramoyl-pentapeptide-transferase [Andreesenia angusta]|nr:phospho-N-acetylmuramoyl-pentapeptide-transferase [Andreesenia angusta]